MQLYKLHIQGNDVGDEAGTTDGINSWRNRKSYENLPHRTIVLYQFQMERLGFKAGSVSQETCVPGTVQDISVAHFKLFHAVIPNCLGHEKCC
jgi:hypothetical protein